MIKKYVCGGDMGQFKAGQVLEDRDHIALYIALVLNEGRFSGAVTATNQQILEAADKFADDVAIESIDDVDDEMNLLEELEEVFPDNVSAGA